MNSNPSALREFIKSLFQKLGAISAVSLFSSKHARALDYLEKMPNPMTDPLQNILLKDPKRQMLHADLGDCVGFQDKFKTKCNFGWGDI